MKQRLWMVSLIMAVSLGLCVFSGCRKADDGGTGTKADAPSAPAPAASAPAAGQASDWPADLPKFEGGKLANVSKRPDGQFQGAVFSAIKDPEGAYQKYKADLEAKGWALEEDMTTPIAYVALFDKEECGIHLSVSKDGQMASITYVPD